MAARIRERTGVQTGPWPWTSPPDATTRVAEATADLAVGLLVYCAGADPDYQPFLAGPIGTAEAMVIRNCVVPMQLCHRLASFMIARGRGGIILLGSGAGFAGAPNMVAYGASKAFDMVFAEALWAELRTTGVHVLGLVLGQTDTPALRRLRHELGLAPSGDEPVPGAARPEDVVSEAFDHLDQGPTWIVGEQMRQGARLMGTMSRNELVNAMIQASAAAMGPGRAGTGPDA